MEHGVFNVYGVSVEVCHLPEKLKSTASIPLIMKPSLGERAKLTALVERASKLLVEIIYEELPKAEAATKNDIEFDNVLAQIHKINPYLADSYVNMYNYLQEQKAGETDYYKQLKKS